MRKLLFAAVCMSAFAFFSVPVSAQWGRPIDPNPSVGLKDTYKDYFTIGVAVNRRNISYRVNQEKL